MTSFLPKTCWAKSKIKSWRANMAKQKLRSKPKMNRLKLYRKVPNRGHRSSKHSLQTCSSKLNKFSNSRPLWASNTTFLIQKLEKPKAWAKDYSSFNSNWIPKQRKLLSMSPSTRRCMCRSNKKIFRRINLWMNWRRSRTEPLSARWRWRRQRRCCR